MPAILILPHFATGTIFRDALHPEQASQEPQRFLGQPVAIAGRVYGWIAPVLGNEGTISLGATETFRCRDLSNI